MSMLRKPSGLVSVVAIVALFLGVTAAPAAAQRRPLQFLSDAETEHTIRDMVRPVFEAAGINPTAVSVVLVNDRTLNAFVSGGQNIFLNTGLLLEVENSNQLIGVIAHETGHIAGGHLARGADAMENAFLSQMIGLGLGIVGGIASGNASVGAAGAMFGQQMANRNFLSFSRAQESTADVAGLSYLERAGISPRGTLEFLQKLDQENPLLTRDSQTPYTMTHPLNRERIDAVRAAVARSRYADKPPRPQDEEGLHRVQAKLQAYLDPAAALRRYRPGDTSTVARYGRTYAYFRQGDGKNALPLVDGLIASEPKNPFFHETRGDLMLQTGRPAEAVPSYRKAVEIDGSLMPIRVSLAHALMEQNDAKLADEAIRNLNVVVRSPDESGFAWRLMARAQSLKGNEAMAVVATAEDALISGDIPRARALAERAEKLLPTGSPGWLRAQDIRSQVEGEKKK
jgi:predicted Zn-dependent protease